VRLSELSILFSLEISGALSMLSQNSLQLLRLLLTISLLYLRWAILKVSQCEGKQEFLALLKSLLVSDLSFDSSLFHQETLI